MPSDLRSPTKSEPPLSGDAAVLSQQRDANEHLVLAAMRAGDEADAQADRAEELAHHAAELRSVAEFRERLIGIVGHDLRNPLNTMLMASGLLLAHGDLGDADARLVSRIVNSGERMARMITQLLDFTRARLGGGFPLTLARADLGAICSNIVDELRLSSSAAIRLTVAGDLGGTWDADRLSEVVSNLTSNAIDHAAAATPVVIDVHGDDGWVVAAITNHGACIPAADLPMIFEAFRGTESTERGAGHLGLGLYISSEVVRSHGGTLAVRSSDGTTTFTMRLPRTAPPPPRPPLHKATM